MTTDRIAFPAGSGLARIRAGLPSLVPSERRVAEVCLQRPEVVAEWSAAELAEAAGTSRATVVRACRSLGFRGLQHLRLVLARDAAGAAAQGRRVRLEDGPDAVVEAVFHEGVELLRGSLGPLDREAYGHAVRLLAGEGRLLVSGNGASAPAAMDAALRLLGAGCPAEAPTDALTQQLTARLLGPGDVCLLISSSGANELTLLVAEAARAAGARLIGLTSVLGSPLGALADADLVVGVADPTLRSDVPNSRVPHALLISALALSVGHLRAAGQVERLEAMYEVMARSVRPRPGEDE